MRQFTALTNLFGADYSAHQSVLVAVYSAHQLVLGQFTALTDLYGTPYSTHRSVRGSLQRSPVCMGQLTALTNL